MFEPHLDVALDQAVGDRLARFCAGDREHTRRGGRDRELDVVAPVVLAKPLVDREDGLERRGRALERLAEHRDDQPAGAQSRQCLLGRPECGEGVQVVPHDAVEHRDLGARNRPERDHEPVGLEVAVAGGDRPGRASSAAMSAWTNRMPLLGERRQLAGALGERRRIPTSSQILVHPIAKRWSRATSTTSSPGGSPRRSRVAAAIPPNPPPSTSTRATVASPVSSTTMLTRTRTGSRHSGIPPSAALYGAPRFSSH
jgi:hypothetical protein